MQKNSSPKYVNSGVVIIVVIILVEHREIWKNFQSRYFGPCTLGSFVFWRTPLNFYKRFGISENQTQELGIASLAPHSTVRAAGKIIIKYLKQKTAWSLDFSMCPGMTRPLFAEWSTNDEPVPSTEL